MNTQTIVLLILGSVFLWILLGVIAFQKYEKHFYVRTDGWLDTFHITLFSFGGIISLMIVGLMVYLQRPRYTSWG